MNKKGFIILAVVFFLLFMLQSGVYACNQHPCLLFNSSEISLLWSNLQSSPFSGRIPSSTSNFIGGINSGGNANIIPEGAALRCLLDSSNTASSTACTTSKSNLMWNVQNLGSGSYPIDVNSYQCGACGATAGGRLAETSFVFDLLKAKSGVLNVSEEQQIVQWFEARLPDAESAFNTLTVNGNAALDNYDLPMAYGILSMYAMLQGSPYTNLSASFISSKINNYIGKIRNATRDFDNIPPEGLNYHVYSMPFAVRAAIFAENNGYYSDMLEQSVYMPILIGDLYFGDGVSFSPTTEINAGNSLGWQVESSVVDNGLGGYSPNYLYLLNKLYSTDSWTAKKGIERWFTIDAIVGNSRSDYTYNTNAYLVPALFYNSSLNYSSNLDSTGYLPASFYRDQKNNAPPTGRDNGFDLTGDGGFHIISNKLEGNGRTNSLYLAADGYMQHISGAQDGSTEKYAGSFPVEVNPGRGGYPSPGVGHRRIDFNIFLSSADFSSASSNFNYYEPTSLANSQHNYEGKFKYHLEGRFASGAEGEHKRIWMMDCATCRANRLVAMISNPDDKSYILEYVETQDSSVGVYDKRSHSLVQAATFGNGYQVVSGNNKGATRFFYPSSPTVSLPSAVKSFNDKNVYENKISQTTTSGNPRADWFYLTELITDNRQTPAINSLNVTNGNGYAGVVNWTDLGLNYSDYLSAKKDSSINLSLQYPFFNLSTNARVSIVRAVSNGSILNFAVFNATFLIVNGDYLLQSNEDVSVSVGEGVQIQTIGSSLTGAQVFATTSNLVTPGNTDAVLVDGNSSLYSQQGNYIIIGNILVSCNGAAPLCSSQQGVCSLSTQSCVSGSYVTCTTANYLAHNSSYQQSETSCDGLDNDCDGTTDEGCTSNTTSSSSPASTSSGGGGGGGGGGTTTRAPRVVLPDNSFSPVNPENGDNEQNPEFGEDIQQLNPEANNEGSKRGITGLPIFGSDGKLNKTALFIFFGAIFLGIAIYFFVKRKLMLRRLGKLKQKGSGEAIAFSHIQN